MTPAADASGDGTHLTNDELFETLSSQMRRIVLFHLHQQGAATVDELVDIVRAYTDTQASVGADDPHRVAMTLAQHHLPHLERLDLITYDRLHETINLKDTPQYFGVLLNLALHRELRSAEIHEQADESE